MDCLCNFLSDFVLSFLSVSSFCCLAFWSNPMNSFLNLNWRPHISYLLLVFWLTLGWFFYHFPVFTHWFLNLCWRFFHHASFLYLAPIWEVGVMLLASSVTSGHCWCTNIIVSGPNVGSLHLTWSCLCPLATCMLKRISHLVTSIQLCTQWKPFICDYAEIRSSLRPLSGIPHHQSLSTFVLLQFLEHISLLKEWVTMS